MEITAAQRDVRTLFMGGFAGQLVSSVLWLASAAAATWGSQRAAMIILVAGGFFIFPLTQLTLCLMGRPSSLPRGHPMNALAMQVAFTLPLTLPLVFATTAYHRDWFYPAFMIVLGAHYLPFIFLYGMWQFGALAAVLIASGVGLAMYASSTFSIGAWVTALVLLVFAFVGRQATRGDAFRFRASS